MESALVHLAVPHIDRHPLVTLNHSVELFHDAGAHVHRCQVDPLVRLGGAVVAELAEVVDGPDARRLHQADWPKIASTSCSVCVPDALPSLTSSSVLLRTSSSTSGLVSLYLGFQDRLGTTSPPAEPARSARSRGGLSLGPRRRPGRPSAAMDVRASHACGGRHLLKHQHALASPWPAQGLFQGGSVTPARLHQQRPPPESALARNLRIAPIPCVRYMKMAYLCRSDTLAGSPNGCLTPFACSMNSAK